MDDLNLIKELQNRDPVSFARFYDLFKSRVYNTSLSLLQNREDAEEVTQDVLVEIFKSAPGFKGDATVSTWVYRITVNKSLDAIKHRQRKKRMGFLLSIFGNENQQEIEIANFDHPGVALENKENAQILFRQIDTLPGQQKAAFILSQVEGLTQREIADILKTSEKAVESLIQRAKSSLKKKLENFYRDRRI